MSIFRRLVVRNIITLIILMAALVYIYSIFLNNYMQTNQAAHNQALVNYVDHHETLDVKQLAKDLRSTFNYSELVIKEFNGSSLYSYEDKSEASLFSEHILNVFDSKPPKSKATSEQKQIKINYKLSFQAELALFDSFFIQILAAIFVVFILLSISIRLLMMRVIGRTVKNISKIISEYTLYDTPMQWHFLPKEFTPLASSLESLDSAYTSKVDEWKTTSQKYRDEARRCELTGLKKRLSFAEFFEGKLEDIENLDFGVLSITRATQLDFINQNRSYQAGSDYITEIAKIIQKTVGTYTGAEVYRINGTDFAAVLPSVTIKESENFAVTLQGKLGEYQKLLELESAAYTGIVSYEAGRSFSELLALCDTAVCIAQTKYPNAWHMQTDTSVLENVSAQYGNQNWREVIDDVISNARATLYYQPIQPTKQSSNVYSEVLARFNNADGQALPTASFIASAERLDKIIFVDKMIIEQTMELIKKRGLKNQYFGINLTAKSAHDEQFSVWLERRLLREPAITSKLVFEVTEFGMQQNLNASKRFITMIHRTGARFTVERFGMGMMSFKFFKDLKPDFIKLDGSYSANIHDDKNNQYFIRVMVDLAHRLGVHVLAENVEQQEEKHTLEELFVDGTQGFFIGKPVEF